MAALEAQQLHGSALDGAMLVTGCYWLLAAAGCRLQLSLRSPW